MSPSASVVAISIGGPELVRSGSTETYAVTARLADGALVRNAAPTTWSSDDPRIATIDGDGRLTAHNHGAVTIRALHQGKSAHVLVRVPANDDNPGGANLVISFRPSRVAGSPVSCPGFSLPGTPTWTFTVVTTETQGVGFTLKEESVYLYNEAGQEVYREGGPDEDYLAPHSSISNEICLSLLAWPSGFFAVVFDGVDDRGHRLTFASSRLRLSPVGTE